MVKRALRIAIGGSAADPPHKAHLKVIEMMMNCGRFDKVIWIISGPRLGKKLRVCPNHRIAMTELLLRDLRVREYPDLEVIYDDIYETNQPTIVWLQHLAAKYPKHTELVWFTGADSVVPQEQYGGKCEMQATWVAGERLYHEFNFVIFPRRTYQLDRAALPKNFRVMETQLPNIASSEIRRRIGLGQKFEHFTTQSVAEYIKRHGLYGYRGEI